MSPRSLPVLPFYWTAPSPIDLVLFCSVKLIGGVSQYWVTQAPYYARRAAVSKFNYTAVISSAMLGLGQKWARLFDMRSGPESISLASS
jgi:hypothetical protein